MKRNPTKDSSLGFFSKKLSGAETRYSTYARELLVAYLGTRHFLHTIEGRFTTLLTDHKPLIYVYVHLLDGEKQPLDQTFSFLSQYIHTVEHVQGENNVVPDALSRFEVSASQTSIDLKQ